jgi:hypothetical protein
VNKPPREIDIDEVLPAGRPGRAVTAGDDPLIQWIARLMDTAFVIPGTKIRFGIDPIIGLIPGLGDTAGALVSTLLILQSARHGVPKIVLARMALNVLVNSGVGAIPIVGDLFSAYFKSNVKNYALLKEHAGPRRVSTGRDWLFVIALIVGMLLLVTLLVIGAVTLLSKLIQAGAGPGRAGQPL